MPVEPPRTGWTFPSALPPDDDLVAIGADLEPGTLLAAYRAGLFPMPLRRGQLGWFAPVDRAVLPVGGLRVTGSMRRSARRFTVTVDQAFGRVVEGCADPRRDGGWIDADVVRAYTRLHELGWAHSLECWTADGRLGGGLYGVAIGGLFCGESMFHVETDASKVALMGLVERLSDGIEGRVVDVQWSTSHLASLGVVIVGRDRYQELLARALPLPLPVAFSRR